MSSVVQPLPLPFPPRDGPLKHIGPRTRGCSNSSPSLSSTHLPLLRSNESDRGVYTPSPPLLGLMKVTFFSHLYCHYNTLPSLPFAAHQN